VILRPYQESCLDACLDALDAGVSRIGVSLPTGSGKTTVFISLLSRIRPPSRNKTATRSLVIVNSIELARQAAAQAETLFPEWEVEIEQGVKHKATGLADVYAFFSSDVLLF
jgi:ATP-dependent helicase IRC3